MRESSGVGTEADIHSGCLHQFFSLLIFFISDLPESEVAPSQVWWIRSNTFAWLAPIRLTVLVSHRHTLAAFIAVLKLHAYKRCKIICLSIESFFDVTLNTLTFFMFKIYLITRISPVLWSVSHDYVLWFHIHYVR